MKIPRHRSALGRKELSRPIRLALEAGLISQGTTVLDYGCGRGDDLRGLEAHEMKTFGWDPVYRTEGERCEGDIVNLGCVANVIEDKTERSETLRDAWRLAKKLLIVSARLLVEVKNKKYGVYNGTNI